MHTALLKIIPGGQISICLKHVSFRWGDSSGFEFWALPLVSYGILGSSCRQAEMNWVATKHCFCCGPGMSSHETSRLEKETNDEGRETEEGNEL